ncbi:MAG: hypothetical protein RDU25_00320 [Patescibacteria group bacterium]|nr:hypothetical protein [Patescibacteria group bacterium]
MNDRRPTETRTVYAITERGEKSYWTRIGIAYVNRDGSLTCRLDALPVSGTLQIRADVQAENDVERR